MEGTLEGFVKKRTAHRSHRSDIDAGCATGLRAEPAEGSRTRSGPRPRAHSASAAAAPTCGPTCRPANAFRDTRTTPRSVAAGRRSARGRQEHRHRRRAYHAATGRFHDRGPQANYRLNVTSSANNTKTTNLPRLTTQGISTAHDQHQRGLDCRDRAESVPRGRQLQPVVDQQPAQ